MATLPMLIDSSPDARGELFGSRGVFAPGGYEWWRVEARSLEGLRVELDFQLGSIGRRGWKAYRRYVGNPTRRRPPLPGLWPMVSWRVLDRNGVRMRGRHGAEPGDVDVSAERLAVRIGAGRLEQGEDGSIRVVMDEIDRSTVDLVFRPRWAVRRHVQPLLDGDSGSVHHWWACDGVVHDVEGMVREGNGGRGAAFRGVGMCCFHYGTRPPAEDVAWWMRMSVIDAERLVIGDVVGGGRQAGGGVWRAAGVEWSGEGMREFVPDVAGGRWAASGWLRPGWPEEIGLADGFRLVGPRRVESSVGESVVSYAVVDGDSGGGAVADVVVRRPRWLKT